MSSMPSRSAVWWSKRQDDAHREVGASLKRVGRGATDRPMSKHG